MEQKEYTKTYKPADYTDKELTFRNNIIAMCQDSVAQRNQKFVEFDDQTYEQYYESNEKAANSYIKPRANEEDVRVVTGTTKNKKGTLLSALLSYNFGVNVKAFDPKDRLDAEIGSSATDCITKSRQIEEPRYDEKRIAYYNEYCKQGNVFIQENWWEYEIPDYETPNASLSGIKVKGVDFRERIAERFARCESSMVCGLNVFPGTIKEFYIENQPYLILRNVLPWQFLEAKYKNWERWENVNTRFDPTIPRDNKIKYDEWMMQSIKQKSLGEELFVFEKWSNRMMIMVNGTMMLPIMFPLKALLGTSEYPVVKGDADPISRYFFWSKSIPADTKVDQQLFDEFLRLALAKTRRSFKPPMGNNTGQELSNRIFMPGTMTPNIDEKKLFKLLPDDQGVTQSEFAMIEYLKGIIDQKSVSPIMEGQPVNKVMTARESMEIKQQGMAKMGLPVLGIMNMEIRLAWLRLQNIITHWTDPVDYKVEEVKGGVPKVDKKYREITIDTTLDDGQAGQKIIKFTTGELPTSEMLSAREKFIQKKTGRRERHIYINPELWKSIKYNYLIECTPVPKNSSELESALFSENVSEGFNLFGPQSFKMDYLKQRWATVKKEDYEKMFNQMPEEQQMPMSGEEAQTGQLNQQMQPQKQLSLRDLTGVR